MVMMYFIQDLKPEQFSLQRQSTSHLALLNGGTKWDEKPWFPIPFHTSIQQRAHLKTALSTVKTV